MSTDTKVVAHCGELFSDEPGCVLLIREALIEYKPELVFVGVAYYPPRALAWLMSLVSVEQSRK